MKEDKYCPKCGKKLSFFYLKPNCPACGVDILRYDAEGRLERDAQQAAKEVEALWRFVHKADKAHVIEKYCARKGRPLPWEAEAPSADRTQPTQTQEEQA
ncbi:MAG: hypothetical protein K6C36_09760 [Clostridia bacterium]|nr:hypothetical protein [Clostridia bacterium]